METTFEYACEHCGAIQTRRITPPLKCNHCNRWMIAPADLTVYRPDEPKPEPDPRCCPFCNSPNSQNLRFTPDGKPETLICPDCLAEYPARSVYDDRRKPDRRKAKTR